MISVWFVVQERGRWVAVPSRSPYLVLSDYEWQRVEAGRLADKLNGRC